ncbi:ABC transporter permease [Wenjunlia tyrosinilytica]|uniref:ABC transporter permease n=1 Tax=Wenjunlia tyrosinilytica TaxID=1544741 RepID=A0A917ZX96_9ACTN|nr:ABC transporter permease [Wenjunlia tyrosinilytica]GGO97226.1 ABC transporter permease [Wenjunlia tyrosinilytica]
MAIYLLKRILASLLVVLVVSFLIFLCLYFTPGSPEQAILGPTAATPQTLAAVRKTYGLDDPLLVQYWNFLRGIPTLNLGRSYQSGQSVLEGIGSGAAVTLPLAVGGFFVATTLGICGGVAAAKRRGHLSDRLMGAAAIVAASTPAYATGVLLLVVFGVDLRWFPVSGNGSDVPSRISHLVLPVITLGLVGAATVMRRTRITVAAALERDDVAFARARGLPRREVLFRYVLRHAAVLILTSAGVVLIYMVAATAVVESVFGLSGTGTYLVSAINSKDIPAVQGVAVVITFLVVAINLVTDILYALIDPRIQRGASAR